jgi:hypothetical protein
MASAAMYAEFLTLRLNVTFLKKSTTRSLKIKYNHKFMHLTPTKSVRDVAFLRPQSKRRSQGYCTSLDTEFSYRQGAYDLGPAPQEETVLGGHPTAGSRCKIRG